jgi:hypothetical protein
LSCLFFCLHLIITRLLSFFLSFFLFFFLFHLIYFSTTGRSWCHVFFLYHKTAKFCSSLVGNSFNIAVL